MAWHLVGKKNYTTNIRIDEVGIRHIKALMENLGTSEFRRLYPNVELLDTEVIIKSETPGGAHIEFSRISNTVIPGKSPSVAIDELRTSNERLAAQNEDLLRQLDQEQARANRKALFVGTIVGLLGIAATLAVGLWSQ